MRLLFDENLSEVLLKRVACGVLLSERAESMLRFAADPESAFLAIAG